MVMTTAVLHVLTGPLPTKKTQEAAVSIFDAIALAGEWEGYQVASAKIDELAAGHRCMEIELRPQNSRPLVCASCGQWSNRVHETIHPPYPRPSHSRCPDALDCAVTVFSAPSAGLLEQLSWPDRYSLVTRRLAESHCPTLRGTPGKTCCRLFLAVLGASEGA